MARSITPEKWSAVTVSMIVMNLAACISDAGLGPALIQRRNITTLHKRVALTTSIIIGIVLMAVVLALANTLADFYGLPELRKMLWVIAFSFVLQSFGLISKSLLRRDLRFQAIMWIETAAYAFGYALVGTILTLLQYDAWSIVLATLSHTVVASILYFLAARHSLQPSLDRQSISELFQFGGGLTLSRLLHFAGMNVDKLILARTLGNELVGVFDMAFRLMMLPAKNLGTVIDNVMFPILANVQNDMAALRRGFYTVTAVVSLLCLPLTVFTITVSKQLTLSLLGENWLPAAFPLQLLMISSYFRISIQMCDATIRAVGAVYQSAARKLLFLLSIAFCAWLGGKTAGVPGACIGLCLADAISYSLMSILCCKLIDAPKVEIVWNNLRGVPLALITALSSLLTQQLTGLMELPPQASLAIITLTTAVVISAVIWMQPGILGASGLMLLRRILELLGKKSFVLQALHQRFNSPSKTEDKGLHERV